MTEPLLSPTALQEFRDRDPVRMLASAEAEVRSYCGWHIAPEITETVTVEGSGAALLLPTLRLAGIASIVRDGSPLNLDNITWRPNGIVHGYNFGGGEYVVTFTHGHAATPADVAQAVASLASEGIDGIRRVKSWGKGPFTETYEMSSFDADRATLDRYRVSARP